MKISRPHFGSLFNLCHILNGTRHLVRVDKQLKCGPLEAHHENALKREQLLPLKMNILRELAHTTNGCEKFLSSSFNIEESSVTFVNGKIECVRLWRGLLRLRELPYRGNAILFCWQQFCVLRAQMKVAVVGIGCPVVSPAFLQAAVMIAFV